MAAPLLAGLTVCALWAACHATPGSFIATECYGNVLSLSCSAGHRLKVIDDFFGYSPRPIGDNMCRYEPGDCTVTNGRFTSVIHRYCEGKQTCTNFQVDRRFCGTNQTNYEQVEYQCVPDSDVTNFCTEASYSSTEGYLSTPNFPNEYPPDMHCGCSLSASHPDARIRLEATHFIVKFDNPCKDWLEIRVGRHRRRLCGAYRSTLRSHAFNLTFHSDETQGHQGIWLHFSVHPVDINASIQVDCVRLLWPTTTVAPSTTTSEMTTSTPLTTSESLPTTTPDSPRTEDDKNLQLENNQQDLDTKNVGGSSQDNENETDEKEGEKMSDELWKTITKSKNEVRRKNNRITGIIIISICVGGILLLIIILSVLLCINKRRRPKRQAEKERKKRLQQRLNSLSFYDSIPLYDSIGRKAGSAPAQQEQANEDIPSEQQNGVCNVAAETNSQNDAQILDPTTLPWDRNESDDGALSWSQANEGDSDHDSAIYAELDKPNTPKLPTVAPRSVPTGEGPPGYSLHLTTSDKNEDIYTHV